MRTRKFEPVPAAKPQGGGYRYDGGYSGDCYYNDDDDRVCHGDDD